MMKHFSILLLLLFTGSVAVAQTASLRVKITDETNTPLAYATGIIQEINYQVAGDESGELYFKNLQSGNYTLRIELIGYYAVNKKVEIKQENQHISIKLIQESDVLEEIEVFGERNRQPKGLETITRMPLKPKDQIQSISVISNKVIEAQGALTITDAVRNIPGVTLFGSYGGVKESMSARGFRGIPVLKNGVRMDSQFQTASGVIDMQGVESIQMIKGSAAITQGVITDLGNAGGVINVVTKTPNFVNAANVGLRVGSWNQIRPVFDYQTVLNESETVAFRLNGAYESADSYRVYLKSNRVYLNPSLAWKPTEKTTVVLEGDYFNDNRTPHTSAVNLAANQGTNALYVLPDDKFLGFKSDNNNTKMSSMMVRIDHKLDDQFRIRAAYAQSSYSVDNTQTTANAIRGSQEYHIRQRVMSRSLREDKNSTFQFDLIGQELYTGSVKHTAQLGFDYRTADATTTSFTTDVNGLQRNYIDEINIYENFPNAINDVVITGEEGEQIPAKITFKANDPVRAQYGTFGVLAQDVVEFNKYVKGVFGLRYSQIITKDAVSTNGTQRSAWNPMVGVMLSPIEQVNVFGSFTNSTSLRSAADKLNTGEEVGAAVTNQFETGIKSSWLNDRLLFNFTYFHILTSNLSNTEYEPGTSNPTGYVFKAGDLKRTGVEVELNGRILDNLTVMLGYAYLDAQYQNSPSYVNGSAPMNAPKNTANGWIQYLFNNGVLNGLSISTGLYYVGERPVNEYSLAPDGHGNMGGTEPFDMPSYYTLNAQLGYKYKGFDARFYFNNITDQIGLNSYFRGGFINQIDPRNIALSVSYNF